MSFFWSFGTSSSSSNNNKTESQPPGEQTHHVPKSMNHAFRKGVQYNMKIIVRGDVMTGKSTLFHRLQGEEFDPGYISTPEIQVANIPWQYKESNDIIKIEIWDVVDKAHNKTSKVDTGIKLEHNVQKQSSKPAGADPEEEALGLDASTVNVYRNTHGAIFLFDVCKQWTFDYVNNQLADVPENVSVLVLGNFCDKSDERVIPLDQIHATLYQHNQERIEKGAIKPNLIRYAETSMKTGLGLKYIYDYLAVPFLQLQMETLQKQLELKAVEIVDVLEALDVDDKVPEVMQRRRGQDNFDQPSEPHLARQREEMKNMWDQELESIAVEHTSMLEVPEAPSSFVRKDTPPPPMEPVKSRRREGSLVSDTERAPVVDQFDAGELNDDWFGDDVPVPVYPNNSKVESDNEDVGGNPMVAGDEDVESVEYYSTSTKKALPTKEVAAPVEQEEESESENETNNPVDTSEQQPQLQTGYIPSAAFRNEFINNVWSSTSTSDGAAHPHHLPSSHHIASDSDDDDDMDFGRTGTPGSFTAGIGGYEEIEDDTTNNPWSSTWGDGDADTAITATDPAATATATAPVSSSSSWIAAAPAHDQMATQGDEEEEAQQLKEEKPKTKKSSSGKKKGSSSGKKKKKKTSSY